MSEAMDLFDNSNFELEHLQYFAQNHHVLGKMKRETGSVFPFEFVGFRAKMYSLSCGNKSQKKVKGIKKYVKKHVCFESFLEAIRNPKLTTNATFRLFQFRNHEVRTVEMNKVCLSVFDDKEIHFGRWGDHFGIRPRRHPELGLLVSNRPILL